MDKRTNIMVGVAHETRRLSPLPKLLLLRGLDTRGAAVASLGHARRSPPGWPRLVGGHLRLQQMCRAASFLDKDATTQPSLRDVVAAFASSMILPARVSLNTSNPSLRVA